MSGRKLLKALATERGESLAETAEAVARDDLQVAGPDGAAIRRAAKGETKLKKWRPRAAEKGHVWDSMSKKERKIFKAAWRADVALERLEKVVANREAKEGRSLTKAIGGSKRAPLSKVGGVRAVPHQQLSRAQIMELSARREVESL